MDLFASLLVGRPLSIALIGALFLAGGLLLRGGKRRRAGRRACRIAAGAWLAYAAWEGAVVAVTPAANIRIDLLLIWPAVGLVSLWALYRAATAARA